MQDEPRAIFSFGLQSPCVYGLGTFDASPPRTRCPCPSSLFALPSRRKSLQWCVACALLSPTPCSALICAYRAAHRLEDVVPSSAALSLAFPSSTVSSAPVSSVQVVQVVVLVSPLLLRPRLCHLRMPMCPCAYMCPDCPWSAHSPLLGHLFDRISSSFPPWCRAVW
jgi:hypothetical protein